MTQWMHHISCVQLDLFFPMRQANKGVEYG